MNRVDLHQLVTDNILTGGRRTTALNSREVYNEMIDSLLVKEDDADVVGGYLSIDALTGIVDVSFIAQVTPTGLFLRDDGTWAAAGGGGGTITGAVNGLGVVGSDVVWGGTVIQDVLLYPDTADTWSILFGDSSFTYDYFEARARNLALRSYTTTVQQGSVIVNETYSLITAVEGDALIKLDSTENRFYHVTKFSFDTPLIKFDGIIEDASNVDAISISGRSLYNTTGDTEVQWDGGLMKYLGVTVLNWHGQALNDGAGNPVMYWGSKILEGDWTANGNLNLPSAKYLTLNNETASRLAIIDASKRIIAADTSTYPSLTELAYLKGVTSDLQTQLNGKGYSQYSQACTVLTAIADSTTYYGGATFDNAISTTAAIRRNYIKVPGTIGDVVVNFRNSVTSSGESNSVYLRLNNTTDYLISSAVVLNAAYVSVSAALSVAVVAGDYYEIKLVTVAMATNPRSNFSASVHIKQS